MFLYDVDEAVLQALERGKMHEWTNVEFKAICRKHGLSVRGPKGELMEHAKVHFQRLYQLWSFGYEPCHQRWNIRVVERRVTAFPEKKPWSSSCSIVQGVG